MRSRTDREGGALAPCAWTWPMRSNSNLSPTRRAWQVVDTERSLVAAPAWCGVAVLAIWLLRVSKSDLLQPAKLGRNGSWCGWPYMMRCKSPFANKARAGGARSASAP